MFYSNFLTNESIPKAKTKYIGSPNVSKISNEILRNVMEKHLEPKTHIWIVEWNNMWLWISKKVYK